jgi:hypothetical protein
VCAGHQEWNKTSVFELVDAGNDLLSSEIPTGSFIFGKFALDILFIQNVSQEILKKQARKINIRLENRRISTE